MQLSSLVLTAVVGLAGFQGTPQGQDIEIEQCVVKLMDEVKLPANLPSQEAGVLTALRTEAIGADGKPSWVRVRAGMAVKKGQLLGQIDNQMAKKLKEVAQYKLEIAMEEAGNQVSVDYAKAAHDVAIADYESAKVANRNVTAIPKAELRRLALLCEQFKLQTEQAEYELGIAAISVQAQQAQLEAAEHDLARRDIVSPIDGVIEEVYPHEGEWLHPGDPIVYIVRMDRLWVQGRLDATKYSPADVVAGRKVELTAVLPGIGPCTFAGWIDYVSPIVDSDNRFKVRAEVVNRSDERSGQWLLRPGWQTTMTIK